eukprot:TRINITY_DN8973_c0_g1_i1.p1 TRINITY_DN8973_c0_g1~~TRINITY_DN8973_c0_g1_i1.p1  ORF type:complete len:337 (+),score=104.58 TRINITY_DN8973_c0_g1_i1:73-1011(+)
MAAPAPTSGLRKEATCFVPKGDPGPQQPHPHRASAWARSSAALRDSLELGAAAEELRFDPSDGQPYPKQSFIAQYGGTAEWDAAPPYLTPPHQQLPLPTAVLTPPGLPCGHPLFAAGFWPYSAPMPTGIPLPRTVAPPAPKPAPRAAPSAPQPAAAPRPPTTRPSRPQRQGSPPPGCPSAVTAAWRGEPPPDSSWCDCWGDLEGSWDPEEVAGIEAELRLAQAMLETELARGAAADEKLAALAEMARVEELLERQEAELRAQHSVLDCVELLRSSLDRVQRDPAAAAEDPLAPAALALHALQQAELDAAPGS